MPQTSIDLLESITINKEKYYKQCVDAIENGNIEGLKSVLDSAATAGYTPQELEHAAEGEAQESLYFHLMYKLQDMLQDTEDSDKTTDARLMFRNLVKTLYEAGVKPDTESITAMSAMSFGEVEPDIAVLNKNAPYGAMFDKAILSDSFKGREDWNYGVNRDGTLHGPEDQFGRGRGALKTIKWDSNTIDANNDDYKIYSVKSRDNYNSTMYLTTNDTMIYPFYMPYMRFNTKQRIVHDELHWLTAYFYSQDRDFADKYIKAVEAISNQAGQEALNLNETEINEAKNLDGMNIQLMQVMDQLIITRTTNTYNREKGAVSGDEFFDKVRGYRKRAQESIRDIAHFKQLNPAAYEKIYNLTKEEEKEGLLLYCRNKYAARFVRWYYPNWTPELGKAMLRIGFALTHPGTLSRYDALRFDDTPENAEQNANLRRELEYFTNLYIEYKKQFFDENGVLKQPEEIAKLSLPIWSMFVFTKDLNWDLPQPQTILYEVFAQNTTEYTSFDQLPQNFAWVKLCNETDKTNDFFVQFYNAKNNLEPFGNLPPFFDEAKLHEQKNEDAYWFLVDRLAMAKDSKEAMDALNPMLKVGFDADFHPKTTKYTLLEALVAMRIPCRFYAPTIRLLEAGADPDRKDEEGNTVLHIAVKNKYPTYVIEAIIKNTKDINAVNNKGETAFSILAMDYMRTFFRKNINVAATKESYCILLKNGADPYINSEWRETDLERKIEYNIDYWKRCYVESHTSDYLYKGYTKEEVEQAGYDDAIETLATGFTHDAKNYHSDKQFIEEIEADCRRLRPDLPFVEHISDAVKKYPQVFKRLEELKQNNSPNR